MKEHMFLKVNIETKDFDSIKPTSEPKNNILILQVKKTKNFTGTNLEHFDIYKDKKHILTFINLLINLTTWLNPTLTSLN